MEDVRQIVVVVESPESVTVGVDGVVIGGVGLMDVVIVIFISFSWV